MRPYSILFPRPQSPQELNSSQKYQAYLDASTPYVPHRWAFTTTLLLLFFLRIVFAQGWYIVAYCLGIYLLNLFLAFLQPKFDPSLTQDEGLEDGGSGADGEGRSSLPTKQDEEFRPFIRRLPEFKFWYSATRMIVGCFVASWFEIFNLPVFWPVLVVYWLILFSLTSESVPCVFFAQLWSRRADMHSV
jgi:Rer1 family